jgi:putative hemolysin
MPALARSHPLAVPESPDVLAEEVARLPSVLVAERDLRVLLVRAGEAPALLREVGLQRERTFRLAGEGSGRPRDVDAFDDAYLHLVLWDDQNQAVAGGYRLGLVGELTRAGGLYSQESFHYDSELLQGPLVRAMELGRSFVVPEHQRTFLPLLLLWRGIGAVLDRWCPDVHLLVGSVSVSAAYSLASRRAVAAYLLSGERRSAWADQVKARRPFRADVLAEEDLRGLEENVLARDGRKPPILVKHYLQLGMRGLACGVDPTFGGCLDVLCVADLRDAPLALLRRFMGEPAAVAFYGRHGVPMQEAA